MFLCFARARVGTVSSLGKVFRTTRSVCPTCLRELEAEVREDDGRVWLVRECPDHGTIRAQVGVEPWYQEGLSRDFFTLNGEAPVTDDYDFPVYNLLLTMRCNMRCPICSVNGGDEGSEMTGKDVDDFLSKVRGVQINLFGGEPTLRDDLVDIVRRVRKSGNLPVLFTNGKRLIEPGYLDDLLVAGLSEVRLQFDSFDDASLERLRGERLAALHEEVLSAIEARKVPTVLEVAVARGINEGELGDILRYAVDRPFIRAVGFRSLTRLGRARRENEIALTNDELALLLEEQTDGQFTLRDLYRFQRLFFALYHVLGRLNCFYNHHIILVREPGRGFIPLPHLVDLAALEPSLDTYRERVVGGSWFATPFLLAALGRAFLTRGGLRAVRLLWRQLLSLVTGGTVAVSGGSGGVLVVGFGSPCDMLTYDLANTGFCQGGNVSLTGIATTADDNLQRERDAITGAGDVQ